jgi:hypothetical protein
VITPTARGHEEGVKDVHPTIQHDMVKFKIEEQMQAAARERLAQAVRKDRPRSIDIATLGERLRVRLFGGPALGGRPMAEASA